MADAKAVASVQRALRKVDRAHEAFVAAKTDDEKVSTYDAFSKAKKSYGRALAKADDSQ